MVCSTDSERSSLGPHFDALTAYQSRAFEQLKELCQENDLTWPVSELEGDPEQGSNDNTTLLRYLRARSYDPQAAFKQYAATAAWRRKHRLDSSYDYVDITKFERTRRLLPQWTGRRDRSGIPLFAYVVSEIRTDDVVKTAKDDPDLTSVFLPAEYVTQFIQPLCTKMHPNGVTIASSTNIIDLSGVGLRSFWTLRNLLQTSSNMATAHYPESVERIFVIGAPSFFPMVWGFITKWFDAATTSKISMLPAADVLPTLLRYIDIEDIPKRFGGNLDWNFGMHPILDDRTKAMVGPRLAVDWIEGPVRLIERSGEDVIVAVGKDNGKTRREVGGKPQDHGKDLEVNFKKSYMSRYVEHVAATAVTA